MILALVSLCYRQQYLYQLVSASVTHLYHVKNVQIRDIESNLNSDGNTDERLKLCLVYSFVPIKKCRRLI